MRPHAAIWRMRVTVQQHTHASRPNTHKCMLLGIQQRGASAGHPTSAHVFKPDPVTASAPVTHTQHIQTGIPPPFHRRLSTNILQLELQQGFVRHVICAAPGPDQLVCKSPNSKLLYTADCQWCSNRIRQQLPILEHIRQCQSDEWMHCNTANAYSTPVEPAVRGKRGVHVRQRRPPRISPVHQLTAIMLRLWQLALALYRIHIAIADHNSLRMGAVREGDVVSPTTGQESSTGAQQGQGPPAWGRI
jgi:hypothetical protein